MRTLLVSTLFIAAAAHSTGAMSKGCAQPEFGFCIATHDVNIPVECEEGSTQVDTCDQTNKTGNCALKFDEMDVTATFYPGFPVDAKEWCTSNGGSYTGTH